MHKISCFGDLYVDVMQNSLKQAQNPAAVGIR